MRRFQQSALLMLAIGMAACGGPTLDTRTFELQYLDADEAARMVDPYIYGDRPEGAGAMSAVGNTLTVRETPDNLEKIARVLAQFDRPKPRVRLHFQLIEADGATTTDSAIADVEAELRKLFRYRGYKLLNEAFIGGTQGSHVEQVVGEQGESIEDAWVITARIGNVRAVGDSGTVELTVGVRSLQRGALETTLIARSGQRFVVGNAQLLRGGGTLIVTVRPELVF